MTKLDVSFPAFTVDDAGTAFGWDLAAVAAEFPDPDDPRWMVFRGRHEPLKRQGGTACWGPATVAMVLDLMSPGMCQAVAHQLGYPVLLGDVYGGGMHLSGPGAHLDIHADFNRHPQTNWRRRANLLVYLNEGWQPEWGGCLELDHALTIPPEMGTLVLFETSDTSWHGHPVPITDGHWRKSVAVYYYDPAEVVDRRNDHSTLWFDEVSARG